MCKRLDNVRETKKPFKSQFQEGYITPSDKDRSTTTNTRVPQSVFSLDKQQSMPFKHAKITSRKPSSKQLPKTLTVTQKPTHLPPLTVVQRRAKRIANCRSQVIERSYPLETVNKESEISIDNMLKKIVVNTEMYNNQSWLKTWFIEKQKKAKDRKWKQMAKVIQIRNVLIMNRGPQKEAPIPIFSSCNNHKEYDIEQTPYFNCEQSETHI